MSSSYRFDVDSESNGDSRAKKLAKSTSDLHTRVLKYWN